MIARVGTTSPGDIPWIANMPSDHHQRPVDAVYSEATDLRRSGMGGGHDVLRDAPVGAVLSSWARG